MDTKQLEIFLSVAQSLNFTKAAQLHYMTQPAISHQITELENELGAKLFYRTSHQVALTSSGEEFVAHARDLVARTRLAHSRVYDIAHGKDGHLRILTVQGCMDAIMRCVPVFSQRYPNIKIEADMVTGAEQISSIIHDDADIYISFSSLLDSNPQIEWQLIQRKSYSLLMPAGSDPIEDTSDLSHLADTPFICERDTDAPFLVSQIMEICRNRGLVPKNIHWCNSAISQLLAIKCGLGFSLTPSPHSGVFTDDLTIIPISGEDAIADDAIGWRRNTGNQAVPYFLEVVREVFSLRSE